MHFVIVTQHPARNVGIIGKPQTSRSSHMVRKVRFTHSQHKRDPALSGPARLVDAAEKLRGAGVLGVVEDLLGQALLHDHALLHEDHTVGHGARDGHALLLAAGELGGFGGGATAILVYPPARDAVRRINTQKFTSLSPFGADLPHLCVLFACRERVYEPLPRN